MNTDFSVLEILCLLTRTYKSYFPITSIDNSIKKFKEKITTIYLQSSCDFYFLII